MLVELRSDKALHAVGQHVQSAWKDVIQTPSRFKLDRRSNSVSLVIGCLWTPFFFSWHGRKCLAVA